MTRQLIRRGILAADQDLFYPVYYDPPATAHVRHRLEALCHRAMVFDRLGMDRLLAGTAQPTR
ncbi:hypothetical protein [Desulfosarcina cetonica]|uniref:hypothetical protein n=1 Tax=Desulfosarcina cetonica TaxID=90730 RepID=UPI0006CF8945|nr:hypothetical protein [Desulfosarcina cetonica]